ncbi:MAG TPA: hypothetical protein PKV86_11255 [Syntrophobacteraceae bacterium]|nr:hypothetical protein [Syntrophobacteraceae bacterium]
MASSEYSDWVTLMEKAIVVMSKIKKPVIASVQVFADANSIGIVSSADDLAMDEEDVQPGATPINMGLRCIGPQVSFCRNPGKKRTFSDAAEGTRAFSEKREPKWQPKQALLNAFVHSHTGTAGGRYAPPAPLISCSLCILCEHRLLLGCRSN